MANHKDTYVLKSLLQRFHRGRIDELNPFLSSEQQLELSGTPSLSTEAVFHSNQWVSDIHYSWLSEFLNQYNQAEKSLFNRALSKMQKKHLLINDQISSTGLNHFFRFFLAKKIGETEKIDLDPLNLPRSELNSLLSFSKSQLTKLIDFLSIHDLAAELRQVIDSQMLEKVYAVLTNEQLQFLHYCSKLPVKWISPRLNLAQWDGQGRKLYQMLHSRGLYRLSYAISDENSALIWHISHRLDIGRGKAIIKILDTQNIPPFVSNFKDQVLHIAKRFNPA